MPSTELGLLNCGFFSVLSFVEMPKSALNTFRIVAGSSVGVCPREIIV